MIQNLIWARNEFCCDLTCRCVYGIKYCHLATFSINLLKPLGSNQVLYLPGIGTGKLLRQTMYPIELGVVTMIVIERPKEMGNA